MLPFLVRFLSFLAVFFLRCLPESTLSESPLRAGAPWLRTVRRRPLFALPGGDVQRELVHDRFQGVGCRNSRQGGVVCGGDAAVHRRRRGMVGELEVDRSGCALAIDLRLEGVQSRLVGFTRQALRQARVHGHQSRKRWPGWNPRLRRGLRPKHKE